MPKYILNLQIIHYDASLIRDHPRGLHRLGLALTYYCLFWETTQVFIVRIAHILDTNRVRALYAMHSGGSMC